MELALAAAETVAARAPAGLTGAALATALRRTPGETERILDNARAFLRQHLVESGCRLKESETRA